MIFGNISPSAQNVLEVAVGESRFFNHYYIGTEHLFIGLCKVSDPEVNEVFQEFGIDPLIRRELRACMGPGIGQEPVWGKEIILTPRVQQISKCAEGIATTCRLAMVEPIHLLLALLLSGDGVAVRLLKDKKIDMAKIIPAIEERIQRVSEELKLFPSAQKTPLLNRIGRNLTMLARQGKIDPVIGRKEEIKQIAQIITRKKKNNPVLIGEAGVGKTAVVEGLALRLVRDDIPEELQGLRVIEVGLAGLVAGTRYRGDFEERVQKVIDEASKNKDVILFIDEMHTIVGAGKAEGSLDASNILKPALARGDLRCIGATTIEEYRRHIEKDAALERRFQPVLIEEPSREDALQIVQGLQRTYEAHYKAKISDEALRAAVDLSIRYIPDRRLPDKAIDLIDDAFSRQRLKTLSFHGQTEEDKVMEVGVEDIASVVSKWTGIPVNKLTEGETSRLFRMEEILRKRVIGQDEAIQSVANAIRAAKAGLANPNRPVGVFLFLGPTGTGKTELAKSLAEFLFDDERRMIRYDMSEYMEAHSVSKLIGAPPGYVGYEQEGQLTGAVRTQPYSVILFDEIEKAHPDISNLFLQIFDEGRLRDSKGRKVDFTNAIIIMTSNIAGFSQISQKKVGFVQADKAQKDQQKDTEDLYRTLGQTFRRELINRIDRIVVFRPLGKEQIRLVIDKFLNAIRGRLSGRDLSLEVSDEVYDVLIEKGYNETFGAREMDRVIQRLIVELLTNELLNNRFKAGDTIHLVVESGRIHCSI